MDKKTIRYIAAATLIILCGLGSAKAQRDTIFLSAKDIARGEGVNIHFVEDTVAMQRHLNELHLTYPQMADTCIAYNALTRRVLAAIQESGTLREDGRLWIDSISCYSDFAEFQTQATAFCGMMQRLTDNYTRLEQRRVEQERRAAEMKALQEKKRKQDADDAQLAQLKQQIATQHNEIESICMAAGITEKTKIKELKDLRYSYLPIYNKYDLTPTVGNDDNIRSLTELADFQRELLDSILGPNSYNTQISNFPNTLHTRAGKIHTEVYKSYQKVFKKIAVSSSFNSLDDYRHYIQSLKDIITVQGRYLKVIDYREQIQSNTQAITNRCGKKFKDVLSSYKTVLDATNQVPTFTTVGESDKYLEYLDEFTRVQERYLGSIDEIEAIQMRGDSLLSLCTKPLSDVQSAYGQLVANTSFVPSYMTLSGANFFHNAMDDFAQLQRAYIDVIGQRLTIVQKGDSIVGSKVAPKGLATAYKECRDRVVFTPSFNDMAKAKAFSSLMDMHIKVQNKYLAIIDNNVAINDNSQKIKNQSKSFSNISKAYSRLFKTYDLTVNFRTESDVDAYLRLQEEILSAQGRFLDVLSSSDGERYNNQLKNEKDIDRIKLSMEIR